VKCKTCGKDTVPLSSASYCPDGCGITFEDDKQPHTGRVWYAQYSNYSKDKHKEGGIYYNWILFSPPTMLGQPGWDVYETEVIEWDKYYPPEENDRRAVAAAYKLLKKVYSG
jgi:hypothetical protein